MAAILYEQLTKKGEARGKALGVARGIISTGRRFGISDSDIISQLVAETRSTEAEAAKKIAEYDAEQARA